jgi:hypothetical protein
MSKGILFYNYGRGCLPRMAVAIHSLRKHYDGNVTLISDGEESDAVCNHFAIDARLKVNVIAPLIDVKKDKNHHYLVKCRMHELSPYDVSIFLDADTLVLGDLTPLFAMAEANEFVVPQFSDWKSSGKTIARRIRGWSDIKPGYVEGAIAFGPAVNTGVFGFAKHSAFMKDWFRVARRGRKLFIPDETSCQLMLWRYPHHVCEYFYNASCKYDNCQNPLVRVIHYHGRKHLREGLPFNGASWLKAYEEVEKLNIANIKEWTPAGDKRLRKYIESPSAFITKR